MDFEKWFEETKKDANIFVVMSIRGLLYLAFEAGMAYAKSEAWKENNTFPKEQIAPEGEKEIPEDFDVEKWIEERNGRK